VRKGNFLFNVFRRSLDSYSGCILITKPGYEHTVTHTHTIPDECTIFEFKASFYQEILERYGRLKFFTDNDVHSTLFKADPVLELLHYEIVRCIFSKNEKLKIDTLVLELIEKLLPSITEYQPALKINAALKKAHLSTIERAKEFITQNFTQDISLKEVATYSYVSAFHFSRIFKTFTSFSPHQFLLHIRLKNAELLLKNTELPVSDIAFSSGFNSLEHFTAAFCKKYSCPPSRFRVSNFISG
jgi:AraC-like DNA-binding protein